MFHDIWNESKRVLYYNTFRIENKLSGAERFAPLCTVDIIWIKVQNKL